MKFLDPATFIACREEPAETTSAWEVLTIVPRLPTKFCGVGDHAIAVGKALSANYGCRISYLGANPNSNEPVDDGHWILPERTTSALLAALRSANLSQGSFVVLHFSGYSYGSRGICFWLTRAINQFLSERSDVRLITMFHELWAPAPLFSRSGWVVPIQKAIVSKLVKESHIVRTNRAEYARQLELLCPEVTGQVRVRNICSNFGEPKSVPAVNKRAKQILIFQPPDPSRPTGRAFWSGWERLASQLGWPKTIVAGRTSTVPEHESIELCGFVSADDGSQLMLESQFVYFDYYDGYLGKSSFFGSLAAHGIVPVMPSPNHSETDGLYHGRHYLIAGSEQVQNAVSLQAVADEILKWYSANSIAATANDYADGMVCCDQQSKVP
jgi:hypothetical protein